MNLSETRYLIGLVNARAAVKALQELTGSTMLLEASDNFLFALDEAQDSFARCCSEESLKDLK